MKKGTLVGYYDMGNGVSPLVCLAGTGDLVVMDNLCGPTYISEITIEDPIEYIGKDDICEKMSVDGIAISASGQYTFRDGSYYFAPMSALSNPQFVSTYDTEQVYDGEEISYDED